MTSETMGSTGFWRTAWNLLGRRDGTAKMGARWAVLLCAAEACYMTMETVAARMLSPAFGNTNAVWIALVGVILFGSSVGNWAGGRLSAGEPAFARRAAAGSCLAMSALVLAAVLLAQSGVLAAVAAAVPDVRLGAVLGSLALFWAPSLFAGTLPPLVLALVLGEAGGERAVAGKVYAASTVGGLAGTFAGGFLLVPNLPSSGVLCLIAGVLAVLAALADKGLATRLLAAYFAACAVALGALGSAAGTGAAYALPAGAENVEERDGEYSKLVVYDTVDAAGDALRVLRVGNSGYQSATYVDPARAAELVFAYTGSYDLLYDVVDAPRSVLMLGGGGYSYPKHFAACDPLAEMEVVEIDPAVTEVAREKFGLAAAEEAAAGRLTTVNDDARMYLASHVGDRRDAVLNDCFTGLVPPPTMCTVEAASLVKDNLVPGGLYMTNVISSLEGDSSRFIKAEVATLREVFSDVRVLAAGTGAARSDVSNYMVVASDADLSALGAGEDVDTEGAPVLTDAYCPVESLVGIAS